LEKIKSKPGLLNFYRKLPVEVREYFQHLPRLVDEFPLDVSVAYVLAQIESGQRVALYCGIRKLHKADKQITWKAVGSHHLSRAEFRAKFELIYGKAIPEATVRLATVAEAARDLVMHGKDVSDDDKRNGIAHALQYAAEINDLTVSCGGPAPFGDLRGFGGRGDSLDKSTSRWILKGMGFPA
jgi:hypothetical protein